jgi:hypothetical protein
MCLDGSADAGPEDHELVFLAQTQRARIRPESGCALASFLRNFVAGVDLVLARSTIE